MCARSIKNIQLDYIEGYGDEPYIFFEMPGADTAPLKVWEGLLADLLSCPDMSGQGWNGFTGDYHELKGIWNKNADTFDIAISEYLRDLDNYKGQTFNYEETADMLETLYTYLEYAKENGYKIIAKFMD